MKLSERMEHPADESISSSAIKRWWVDEVKALEDENEDLRYQLDVLLQDARP